MKVLRLCLQNSLYWLLAKEKKWKNKIMAAWVKLKIKSWLVKKMGIGHKLEVEIRKEFEMIQSVDIKFNLYIFCSVAVTALHLDHESTWCIFFVFGHRQASCKQRMILVRTVFAGNY